MKTDNATSSTPVERLVGPLRDAQRLIAGECEPDALGSAYHDAGSCWRLIANVVAIARCGYDIMRKEDHECRRGWRSFVCECGLKWAEPTRDRLSPSGENCPRCNGWCVPDREWPDRELQVDEFMNLV